MATLRAITASNWPQIDPDAVDAIEAIIDDYGFHGTFDKLTVTVASSDEDDEDPHLEVYGYAAFEATKPLTDKHGTPIDREYSYTEKFLQRLAPHLQEPLVVETVGYETCRFPLLAGQWVAWPDGTVAYNSFDHLPNKKSTDTSDDNVDAPNDASELPV